MIDLNRLLPKLLNRNGANPELTEIAAKIAWTRAAGAGLRPNAVPFRLYQKTLIVSVADAFAAMTSDRPYRSALPAEQAFLELISRAGTHFDPACVYAFLRVRQQIEAGFGAT